MRSTHELVRSGLGENPVSIDEKSLMVNCSSRNHHRCLDLASKFVGKTPQKMGQTRNLLVSLATREQDMGREGTGGVGAPLTVGNGGWGRRTIRGGEGIQERAQPPSLKRLKLISIICTLKYQTRTS